MGLGVRKRCSILSRWNRSCPVSPIQKQHTDRLRQAKRELQTRICRRARLASDQGLQSGPDFRIRHTFIPTERIAEAHDMAIDLGNRIR